MGGSGVKYVVAAAVLVAATASTGAVASSLITGADVKDGSLTGADVKNGSLTGADVKNGSLADKDLADAPRTWVWKAHYAGDGITETASVTSAKALPASSTVRAYKISFTGATDYCVAHGNPDFPSLNTGWIKVVVTEDSNTQIAAFRTATDLTPTIHADAVGSAVPTAFYVPGSRTHLALSARCWDATDQTIVDIPMQDFTVSVTFQTTPVALGSPHNFS